MALGVHLFLPQMRHVARRHRRAGPGRGGGRLRGHRLHGPPRPAARGRAGHVGGDGDRRVGARPHDHVDRVGHLVLCDAFRHPAVLARQVDLARPRVRGPVRAGHRVGLGARRARDLRHRHDRAAGAGRPAGRVARRHPGAVVRRRGRPRGRALPPRRRPAAPGAHPADPDHHRRRRARGRSTLVRDARRLVERARAPARPPPRAAATGPATPGCRCRSGSPWCATTPSGPRSSPPTTAASAAPDRTPAGRWARPTSWPRTSPSLHAQGIDRAYLWFADFAPVDTLERFGEVLRLLDPA